MNLELDLGFDSMERVELLASLEQTLNLDLPDDFGADVHTVRDLIIALERLAGGGTGTGGSVRQRWNNILSEESTKQMEGEVRFTGKALTIVKFVGLRLLYLLFRIFLRMKVRGIRNLPANGPYLLCPNHLSYIDPLVLCSALPYRHFRRAFFVGASEYIANRFTRMLARLTDTIPVDPDAHLLRAMKVGAYGLRCGRILCIFPEGARSFDGQLKEFKKGAAILSRETGTPIVPVGIRGTHEVWARDSRRIRLHEVTVAFGSPMLLGPAEGPDPYQSDTEVLRSTVAQLVC
jgi:long-chain acyl-CoA synthetase